MSGGGGFFCPRRLWVWGTGAEGTRRTTLSVWDHQLQGRLSSASCPWGYLPLIMWDSAKQQQPLVSQHTWPAPGPVNLQFAKGSMNEMLQNAVLCLCLCMHLCVCVYLCASMSVNICACVFVWVHVYVCLRMCVCVWYIFCSWLLVFLSSGFNNDRLAGFCHREEVSWWRGMAKRGTMPFHDGLNRKDTNPHR